MTNQVAFGIISTSWWAEIAFLPHLHNDERVIIKAVCGRNQERAAEIAEKYDIEEIYADYRDMIAQSELDAVIVASPDDLHYEMAMLALDAGLHILCEKPVAMNANQALEILTKAEEKQVKHLVNYTWHWLPVFQQAKQYIEDGFIGQVYHANFSWLSGFWRPGAYQWRVNSKRSNGVVADLGSHLFHLAAWLMGDVKAVTARLGYQGSYDSPEEIALSPSNDVALVILEFESGAITQLTATTLSNVLKTQPDTSVEIHGKAGSMRISFNLADEGEVEMSFNSRKDAADNEMFEQNTLNMLDYLSNNPVGVRYFVDCIVDDIEPVPSLKDGYKIQKIIDAAIRSHETGQRVEIDNSTNESN